MHILAVTGVHAQNPLTPELLQAAGELNTLNFLMLIFGLAVITGGFLTAALFRLIHHQGRQIDTNSKLAEAVTLTKDAAQQQNRHLEAMVAANERKIGLIESSIDEARAAREGVEKLANAHDSGVHDMRALFAQNDEKRDAAVQDVLAVVERVEAKVDALAVVVAAGDASAATAFDSLRGDIGALKTQLERAFNPPCPPEPGPPATIQAEVTIVQPPVPAQERGAGDAPSAD